MIFSHVQSLLKGGRPPSAVLEAILPDVAEAWARADPLEQREPAFACFLLTREVVHYIVRTLDGRGVQVLPIDGVRHRFELGTGPSQELPGVVELLIDPSRLARSVTALADQGFEVVARSDAGALLRAPEIGTAVSLACELQVAGFCRLTARDLLARAQPDERSPELPMLQADPLDRHAYLVAWATLHRVGAGHARIRELCELLSAERLSPLACARHLTAHGLASAGRYVMGLLDGVHRAHAKQVLAALPRDTLAEGMARLARLGVAHCGNSGLVAVPFHLLEASKWHGARALVRKLAAKLIAQGSLAGLRT